MRKRLEFSRNLGASALGKVALIVTIGVLFFLGWLFNKISWGWIMDNRYGILFGFICALIGDVIGIPMYNLFFGKRRRRKTDDDDDE